MPPAPAPAPRGRALVIAVPTFGDAQPGEESDEPAPLTEFMPYADDLAIALEPYRLRVNRPAGIDLTGARIATEISQETETGAAVQVVHILSHGVLDSRTKKLFVLGSDGARCPSAVDTWMDDAEGDVGNGNRDTYTLFVLDVCEAGAAAELPWQISGADEKTRAWVIAATLKGEKAFDGRLTQALAAALRAGSDGTLGIDPSREFIPWATLRDRVISEVELAGESGLRQRVRSTLLDRTIDPPFFVNPRFDLASGGSARLRGALTDIEDPLADLVRSLDPALDPMHYVERAASRRADPKPRAAYFAGRARELRALTAFLERPASTGGGMRLVTGSPGCGKSALLGILVCAAHPQLRERTREVWQRAATAPAVVKRFAAVHARQRTSADLAASLARQLGLPEAAGASPAAVVRALARGATGGSTAPADGDRVTIVVDAVDESPDPGALVRDLLIPLSDVAGDGGTVRLVVGSRTGPNWPMIEPLRVVARSIGGEVDLDVVDPQTLRNDLRDYVANVFADYEDFRSLRHDLADGIARGLTRTPRTPTGTLPSESQKPHADRDAAVIDGAFLVAGVYLNHVIRHHDDFLKSLETSASDDLTTYLLAVVPTTLPDVVELDLTDEPTSTRAVLAALAWAKGEGMPLPLVAAVAGRLTAGEASHLTDAASWICSRHLESASISAGLWTLTAPPSIACSTKVSPTISRPILDHGTTTSRTRPSTCGTRSSAPDGT